MNKNKFRPLLVIILLPVIFSLSCNNVTGTKTSSSPTVTTPTKLSGTQWEEVSVTGIKLGMFTNISLDFSDGGAFVGDVICNMYGGKYTTEYNNALIMTDVTSTLALCRIGNHAQADNYLQILPSVLSYTITNNYLVLQGKDDKELVILQLHK